ncbi:class I adenylate-forming enzyme family protein [Paenibacillus sp. Y5S-9]|uniref:class I adenylate-forming enzyme family protein n=1 Tax=Paenibacillus sp. Y5S-9 TaxID=3122489 RepID=UPI0030D3A1FD
MKDMEPQCIGEILLHQAERSPDRIAVTFGEENWTYKQLLSTTAALQLKIEERVREGEVVVICLPNSPAYIHAYFAVTLLGAVIMPLYSGSSEAEISLAYRTVDAALCITTHEMKSKLSNQNLSVLSLEDWQATDEETKPIYRPCLANEVALMLQTSGTTGNPKIVQHTHHNLITNVKAHCESLSLTEKDKVLITLPMPFGYCNTSQFLSHLYLGGELVIMTGLFLPSSFMKTMREQDITVVTAVPTMLQALSLLKSDYKSLPHLRYICFGGGQVTPNILESVRKKMPAHVKMVQTYGQTEAGPRITTRIIPEVYEPSNVGQAIRGVEISIRDEEGNRLGFHEPGDVWVHSPSIMKGYYLNPTETDKVLQNGWLRTGDRGYLDERNNLWILGRTKLLIKTGGKQVHPEEIERLIMEHFPLEQAVVKGETDPWLGEALVAYIIPRKSDTPVEATDILRLCRSKLSAYKVPKRVEIVQTLPRTATGKIRRD